MGRYARMLTAVVAVLIASLAVGAASASALNVKVRVEIKQPPPASGSPYLHGLVDRTPVTLPDAGPDVTVNGVTCNSRSAIAAFAKAVPANLWSVTGSGSTTAFDKIDGHPGAISGTDAADQPTWVVYAGGDRVVADPCTAPLGDEFAGMDVLVYLKCGSGPKALLFECFNGQPLILRALQEAPFPTVAINTQFALPVYVQRAPGPWPDWGSTQASWTSLLVTDESNIGILVNQIFHDGSARIEFTNPGPHTIVATDFTSKADPKVAGTVDGVDILHVPDRIPVCVTNGGDGYCGTVKDQQNPFDPGDPSANCTHFGNDGRCGTPDEVGPRTTVTNLKQGQVFRPKKGPTGIRGTTGVADDPAGLKDVKLRVTRVLTVKVKVKPKKRKKKKRSAHKSSAHSSAAAHVAAKKKKKKVRYRKVKRCYYWNEDTLLLERAKRCGTAGGRWWEADLSDLRDTFKADFAMRLPKGTYTLEVQSSDEDGHPDPAEPGRNVLRFVVK